MTPPRIVVAIDPGSAKCGVAVVDDALKVYEQEIVPTPQLTEKVKVLAQNHNILALVVGKGTGSHPLRTALTEQFPSLPLHLVDENFSTLEARERYFEMNPPRWLQRLLPKGLRVPPCPIDDYVAVLLAERYWRSESPILPPPASEL